ncbi:protamine-like [Diorhabda carinulata]|uniref:protamine-like n=1 Tax=Diorhabda carinulata TaxID=1163345 RepID=UPI0025A2C8AE|nr:protamine-like [Diorhabda carinulata]
MTRTSNENLSDTNSNDDGRKTSKNPLTYRKGKITRNPFLNFLREVRKNSHGMNVIDIVVKGANLWRKMDPKDKKVYQEQAKSAPYRPRKRKSRRSYTHYISRSRSYCSPDRNSKLYQRKKTSRY